MDIVESEWYGYGKSGWVKLSKKNKSADVGLAYMKELGFRPERSRSVAYDKLRSVADKPLADNLITIIANIGYDSKYSPSDLYAAKNATLDLSLTLSSTNRADIYRKMCNWVVNHKELFGSCILDLGCDCGIMTCFLARQFPESHIIGIDVIPAAVENAKQLAVRLNVNNVEFICVDAFSFNKPVDTVFSMLVMHELHDDIDIDCRYKTFNDIAKYWSSGFDKIISHISEILSVGGHIISFDKESFLSVDNPMYLSFMYSLYHHGLCMTSYDTVSVMELNSVCDVQCTVAVHDNISDTEKFTDALIFDKYVDDIVRRAYDLTNPEYFEFDAKLMRDVCCGELVYGFYGRSKSGEYSEYSVWRDKSDAQSFIFFRTEGIEKFTRLKSDDLEDVYKMIDFVYKNKSSEPDCVIEWEKREQ